MKKQSMHCILGHMIYFPVVTVYQKNSVFQLYLHKLFWKPLLFSTYIQGLAINIYSYIYTYIWQYVLAKLPVGTSPSWFFYYPILLQQEKEASTFFFYISIKQSEFLWMKLMNTFKLWLLLSSILHYPMEKLIFIDECLKKHCQGQF